VPPDSRLLSEILEDIAAALSEAHAEITALKQEIVGVKVKSR
jgi:hypothetical protein